MLFKSILNETQNYLRDVYKSMTKNVRDFDVLTKLGCYKYEKKSLGISTLIAGIYFACKYSKEPLYGIEKAVNSIGTKTNSIAAFVGGIIGALHGDSIIPRRWEHVQDHNYIDEVSKRLLEIHENRAIFEKPIRVEKIKSISEIGIDSFEIGDEVFVETLGKGKIKSINKQITIGEDRYNLIFDVQFEVGQSCRFLKRLSN